MLVVVEVSVVVFLDSLLPLPPLPPLPPDGAGAPIPAPPVGPCFGAVIVIVSKMVEVSLMVEVTIVVLSPVTLVNVIVLSKTDVDTPVLDSAAGVEVTLMFSPPLGPAPMELL